MRKCVCVYVGHAGAQIGNGCWELYSVDPEIQSDGQMTFEKCLGSSDESDSIFLSELVKKKYVYRAVILDLEPTVINEICSGMCRQFFNLEKLIMGKEVIVKNYVQGNYTTGKEHMELVLDSNTGLQEFLISDAFRGGAGSRLTSHTMGRLFVDCGKKSKLEFAIYPAPQCSDACQVPEQINHALFSLMGLLCNAGEEEVLPQVVLTGSVLEMRRATELILSGLDAINKDSRAISITSTHGDSCNAISDYKNILCLFDKLLQKYPDREIIVVKLCTVPGKIMATIEVACSQHGCTNVYGHVGAQIGDACMQMYCLEPGIWPYGQTAIEKSPGSDNNSLSMFLSEPEMARCISRAVFKDLEPVVVYEDHSGMYQQFFHGEGLITGKEVVVNDCVQGSLSVDYGKKSKLEFAIWPAPQVTGSGMSGDCRPVLQVSHYDNIDRLFPANNLLDLSRELQVPASPIHGADVCVYGNVPAMSLTRNNLSLTSHSDFGILELMVRQMKRLNDVHSEGWQIPEWVNHMISQLIGVLHKALREKDTVPQLVLSGAVSELFRAMEIFLSDVDVVSDVCRALSIISIFDNGCSAVIEFEHCFFLFVKPLQKYPEREDIVVILFNVIENLMKESNIAVLKFYEEEGAVNLMLNILSMYVEKEQHMLSLEHNSQSSDAGSSVSVEFVIEKIVSLIVVMSLDPLVGSKLCGAPPGGFDFGFVSNDDAEAFRQEEAVLSHQYSNHLFNILVAILRYSNSWSSNVLIPRTLICLLDLSYFFDEESTLGERQLEVAEVLAPILNSEDGLCKMYAMNIFRNLTLSRESRDFLFESVGFDKMMQFLDSEDTKVLCGLTGMILNMVVDWEKCCAFKQQRGIKRLIHVLRHFGKEDWQLATLICQVFWNLCYGFLNMHAAFGFDETYEIESLLVDYLDEEFLFGVEEGTMAAEPLASSPEYQHYKEFAVVGTYLLMKLNEFLDTLEPHNWVFK